MCSHLRTFYASAVVLVCVSAGYGSDADLISPKGTSIPLFNGKNLDGLYTWLIGIAMKARELYRLIFERITTTHGTPDFCLKHNTQPSVWWDECGGHLYGANPLVKYEKGKRELTEKLKLAR